VLNTKRTHHTAKADRLGATFAALSDPTRRAILTRLTKGEATVNELAAPFSMSLPSISRHLKVLERAGLISRAREAQWRPCRIEVKALREVDDWIKEYRRMWEARLDRLDDYLIELQSKQNGGKKSHVRKQR
jgi:DNA-binding transcriptional ArsR family regulator